MVKLTNTQPGGIGLPNGPVVPSMGSVDVEDSIWSEAKKHPAIEARLKHGHLLTGDRAAKAADEAEAGSDEMAELRKEFATAYGALQEKAVGLERDVAERDARIAELEKKLAEGLQPSPYAVKDKGSGWYVVTKDGAEVTKSMRSNELAEFDKLSDVDKAAFVDLHKAG